LIFNAVKTKDGPRFRIEGLARIGRLLGIEGAEGVAVLNGRPQGEPAKADPGVAQGIFEHAEQRLRFDLVASA
jgi:hypothetical protein